MNRYMSSVKVLVFMSALGAVSVFADSNVGPEDLEGFFIGVDAAYSHSSVKNGNALQDTYINGQKEESEPGRIYKNKRSCIDPSVSIGYGHFFNNWYLGLSGDVSFGKNGESYVVTDSSSKAGYEARIDGVSYEVKAKGGYYFSDFNSVIYGIAGLKWQNVSYRNFVDGKFSSKAKLKTPIFVLGIGFERSVYKKLSFSAEYEYSWRSSSDQIRWERGYVNVITDMKQKLRGHTVKVGVKYHI